ncbi:MAG: dTDP-4-dehydrorhamnose reductase [bacterium]
MNNDNINNNQKKILVTGAKGQLGKKIIEILGKNHQLILTDSDDMDITDIEAIRRVVELEKPDFIIHGAAYTQVDKAEEMVEICRKVNAFGTENVAKIAKEYDVPLIYISTDFVFDGEKTTPYTEDDKANPLSVYGLTKYEGEEFIRNICEKYYICRIAWLFGELPEGHPGTNFVEVMLRLAGERDSLNVVADQVGSPTYTGDLVEMLAVLVGSQQSVVGSDDSKLQTSNCKQIPYGTYHFSGTGAASWYDFAKEIFTQTNTKIDLKAITSDQYPQKATRPKYSYMDKSKIEKALNIKVRPWQEMLADYIAKRNK